MPNPRGAIVLLTLVVSGLAAWELWPRALVAPAASTQSASPVDRHVDPALHSEPPGQRNALELVHEAETAAPVEGPIAVARTTRPYLQVRVTQAQAPVGGAVVKVWRGRWNDDFLTGTQPPLFVAVTGRDGLARAESTSDELTVAAEFGRARRIANLRGGRASQECELELGSAELTGSVHDANGRPIPGAVVWACPVPIDPKRQVDAPNVTLADATGTFALDGLPSGELNVSCASLGPSSLRYYVTTMVGRQTYVRIGSTPGARHWRGTVVDTRKSAVPGWSMLEFVESRCGERRTALATADGTFDMVLPTGTWRGGVAYDSFGHHMSYAGSAEVRAADVQQDIVLPEQRVLCRLVPGTATTQVRMAELTVHLMAGNQRLVTRPPFLWKGDYWMQWIGLPAGEYSLCSPRTAVPHVESLEQGMPLVLVAGTPVVELDLTVR